MHTAWKGTHIEKPHTLRQGVGSFYAASPFVTAAAESKLQFGRNGAACNSCDSVSNYTCRCNGLTCHNTQHLRGKGENVRDFPQHQAENPQ